ncbi:ABC transporter ATP-binding protein [Candidatus Parcubacteria bacterium]|nr:MAG: ABC transporter ATP-binding protein [Candidatus Parcubacteria bacterium]
MSTSTQQFNLRRGIAVFRKYLRPYRSQLSFIAGLSLLDAVANAMTPLVAGKIFDALITPSSVPLPQIGVVPTAIALIGVWFLIRAVGDLAGWQKSVRQERFGADIHADYLVAAFTHILRLPLSFHKNAKVGDIVNRISRASDRVETIANRIIVDLLPDILSVILTIGIVFVLQPRLAVVVLAAMGLYLVMLLKTAPGLSAISYRMHKAYSFAFGYASDIAMNAKNVKEATAEAYEKRALHRYFRLRAARLWSDYMRIWEGLTFFQRVIVTLMQGGIFIYSYFLVRSGQLTPGGLVAFNAYTAIVFRPLTIIANNWDVVQNGLAAIDRAEKIIEKPAEPYMPANAVILPELKGAVEFRGVSFAYGPRRKAVIENISFQIPAGTSVALVGESGVGKSTLVDLISGFYAPTKGKVLLDGHDVRRLDLGFLRSQIAVVPQELLLFNDTVRHNIRYGSFGRSDAAVAQAAEQAHAAEFIRSFPRGFKQLVGERGVKLSVGQKQRLAIARAILRDPKILILDEPTSALDARSEAAIQESLNELMKDRTTFVIAHRLSTVRKANLILVLAKGEIVEQGTHAELIQKPDGVYRRLYELQIGLK